MLVQLWIQGSAGFDSAATLFAAFLFAANVGAQALSVRRDGGNLRVAAMQVSLLSGEALARLHDGASVNYVLSLAVLKDRAGAAYTRVMRHCIVSFDVFEEKFKATRVEPSPRSMSNMATAAAEAWCLDVLAIAAPSIAADKHFWIGLEYEAELPRPSREEADPAPIGRLLEFFSRKPPKEPLRGLLVEGPFRLQDPGPAAPARDKP
jgi:hypothetical protein